MVYVSDFLYSKSIDSTPAYHTFKAPASVAGDKPRNITLLPYKPHCHFLKHSLGRRAWTNDNHVPYMHTLPQRHFEPLLPPFVFAAGQYDYKTHIWSFRTGFLRWSLPGAALGILHWVVRMERNGWEIKNPTVTQGIVFDEE
ncbi:hypothetical protein XU18_1667 [Perkinsela sp. CCAP 1560/4]|nr:40S ribosomal protein S33 [Perkinsela sp. CCAP 1560/4]KNH07700.1 hypothetical protein XU18_1667 [Perkinsela sp. CCAP 1560/4]|eukprot:KNH04193.1 40S ribosomal protein S33 [Perkinsela sp. CCAP 1560/4]